MYPNFIILLCLVGVAIALVIWGMIHYLVQDSLFEKQGIVVEGSIVAHHDTLDLFDQGLGPESYYLTYRYEYQGTSYTQEQLVSKQTYLSYADGARISVRCLSHNPTRAYLHMK